ncbi:MAG TPA: hypothetical protein VE010_17795, partial [Thermoanaerobaculia bacterium]|nr:hypothetical protein [Thermoanaerobaculia bacterium]
PAMRDPAEAMKYAKMLCAGQPTAGQLDTCAAAAARYGDFENAVKLQTQAIANVRGEATKARFRQRLALYQGKRAYTQARRREQRAIEACDDNADWLKTSVGDRCPDPSTRHW